MTKNSSTAKFVYLLAGLVFLTGVGLLVWFGWGYFKALGTGRDLSVQMGQEKKTENCNYRRLLDGVCVDSADKVNPPLVGVMVENHFDSWPQAGLAEASIVYEAPTEANIPRFLAIYPADTKVDKVGPVRSARPYYLDWLEEYNNIIYLHVGGSPDALDKIKTDHINDWNQFYNGQSYWRENSRTAPHNVYTSSDLWNKIITSNKIADGNWAGWKFNTSSPDHLITLPLTTQQMSISFAPPTYLIDWKYSSSTNQYARYQAGEIHLMENSQPIMADTVIVEEMKMKVIDEEGRKQVTTIGKGKLLVFENGQVISGTWNKSSKIVRTEFYDAIGNEISLNPGHVWIEVVPNLAIVSYK